MFHSSCLFGVDKSGEQSGPSPTQVAVLGDLKLDNLFGFTGSVTAQTSVVFCLYSLSFQI